MAEIGIIGAGTWGTALGVLLCHNGHRVTLWSAFQEDIQYLKENGMHKNLPGAELPEEMAFTASMEEAVREKELLVLAVPSIYVRTTARAMAPLSPSLRERTETVPSVSSFSPTTSM